MVEQRPFKALVVGSSPTQPKPSKTALLLGKCLELSLESATGPYALNTPKYAKTAFYLSSFYQVDFSSLTVWDGGRRAASLGAPASGPVPSGGKFF
jgi:hypothetical protein